jgi:hypothetical protein
VSICVFDIFYYTNIDNYLIFFYCAELIDNYLTYLLLCLVIKKNISYFFYLKKLLTSFFLVFNY